MISLLRIRVHLKEGLTEHGKTKNLSIQGIIICWLNILTIGRYQGEPHRICM